VTARRFGVSFASKKNLVAHQETAFEKGLILIIPADQVVYIEQP
jgi:hypothetical protein